MVLQEREKNMGFMVLLLCLGIGYIGINSQISKKEQRALDEMAAAEDRLNKAREMLKMATEAIPSEKKEGDAEVKKMVWIEPERRPTLTILRDITAKGEADGVKIISTDSSGAGLFKLVVQAPFSDLVRYISFLERTEGSFIVQAAGFSKVDAQVDGQVRKELTATVSLKMKASS